MRTVWMIALGLMISPLVHASNLQYRNVPEPVKIKLEAALDFLRTIHLDSPTPLHQEAFGGAPNYADWFEARVKRITMGGCGGDPSVIACVEFIMPTWLYLTQTFVRGNYSPIIQLGVLLHEARHQEREHNGWVHEYCPVPFRDDQGRDVVSSFSGVLLEGLRGCEANALGSYGVEYLFLSNIADHCVNCAPEMRAEARAVADQLIVRMVDPRAKNALLQDRGRR